jgi:hypothetical protein
LSRWLVGKSCDAPGRAILPCVPGQEEGNVAGQ